LFADVILEDHGVVHRWAVISPIPVQSHSIALSSKTNLLPEAHDLEALEVVEVSPLGLLLALLGVVAVVELALDLLGLPLLLEGNGASATGELLKDEASERQDRERSGVAGDRGLDGGSGTLNENLECSC
jgi:hypothetical protein